MDEPHTQEQATHSANASPTAQREDGGREVAQRIVPFALCERQLLEQDIFGCFMMPPSSAARLGAAGWGALVSMRYLEVSRARI